MSQSDYFHVDLMQYVDSVPLVFDKELVWFTYPYIYNTVRIRVIIIFICE